MTNKLENNVTYSAIMFSWGFNSPSGLCPPQIEKQYQDYIKEINNNFFIVGNNTLISKKYNNSLIDTAVEFKQLIRKYGMFAMNYVNIDTFKLITIKFEGDMINLMKN